MFNVLTNIKIFLEEHFLLKKTSKYLQGKYLQVLNRRLLVPSVLKNIQNMFFFQDLMFSLQTPVAKFGHQSQQDFFLLQENCFLCTVQCWAM